MNEITTQKTAKEINDLHAQIELTARKTIENIIVIGNKLNDVKSELKHGKFNSWCEQNLNISRTTIFRYMSISQNSTKIGNAKTQNEALNLLGKCFVLKHLENGIYLKNSCGSILTIYVKDNYIGYVQILGSSYKSMRSVEQSAYLDMAKISSDFPVIDESFLLIKEDKNCPYFKEFFGNVPNEWFFDKGWLANHIAFIFLVAPFEYHTVLDMDFFLEITTERAEVKRHNVVLQKTFTEDIADKLGQKKEGANPL